MKRFLTLDGNEAVARVAFKLNEVIAIYPITPASPMGEQADQWGAKGEVNLWGTVPLVKEMQSEAGAAGAVHGSLQTGALTTTFTSSQGLLLMIPNMYKIAGELTSAVIHVAARTVGTHALSIFGDHSDLMAARPTGFGFLVAASVQEAHDFALIAQSSTLASRVPFIHAMDGFRTSHEVAKIEVLSDDDLRFLIDDELVRAHRSRGLSPDRPFVRGTAQNPDVFFQAREAANEYYRRTPEIVQETMARFAKRTGRSYRLFDYVGAADAQRVLVLMGSGAEAAEEAVEHLVAQGQKVGLVKVRLFRPFASERFVAALPPTVDKVAVLDRTKEPGSAGEPLYQDVVTALAEEWPKQRAGSTPRVVGGRYGLSSKEFTPAMAAAVLGELASSSPLQGFTVGIEDDVGHLSIAYDPEFEPGRRHLLSAVFWGLGSDGTVGANKNTIKIVGANTNLHAQGYFVYDSKKSGARTISHLRFDHRPIRSPYLLRQADFVGVHQFDFLERFDPLEIARNGATVLINAPFPPGEVWKRLPRKAQERILEKELAAYSVDAQAVAEAAGLGKRINTVMQACFFALGGLLPQEEAIARIKEAITRTYRKRGEQVLKNNFTAVDAALGALARVDPGEVSAGISLPVCPADDAPPFVKDVTAAMIAGKGDSLPVSALPPDGTFPSGTSRWEKRNLADEVPVWDSDLCIQCGKCVMVCPHAAIRAKLVDERQLDDAPSGFLFADAMWKDPPGRKYTLQVAVEDCTGCTLCVDICPVKDKSDSGRKALNMEPQQPHREPGRAAWAYFTSLPDEPRYGRLKFSQVKNLQLLRPLFEFSGACSGCGETPYLKLLSQLYGDRAIVANATGCSSIYGGNLPTTPWSVDAEGRGPAWSNSLFEDNAEFGLGMRLSLDLQAEQARRLLVKLAPELGEGVSATLLADPDPSGTDIPARRLALEELKKHLDGDRRQEALDLSVLADTLVPRSVWIVGGDGWAYDIGYGGLDHVLSSGQNVNLLVLDTEVYSNTGGQASKATGLGAVVKFAAAGKRTPKKDLPMMAMSYGDVYVAQVALGASDTQVLKAFTEAESYDGPSLIIAYSHCIAHGIDMHLGHQQQRLAVESGYWPLFRYDPRREAAGNNPFQLDSKPPRVSFRDYALQEDRYKQLYLIGPDEADRLLDEAQAAVEKRWLRYEQLSRREAEGSTEHSSN